MAEQQAKLDQYGVKLIIYLARMDLQYLQEEKHNH
jgi:hypothetical protein